LLSPHPRTRAGHALAHPAQIAFLSCLAAILFSAPQAHAATCHILESHVPTEAEQAYLKGQYGQAASLYQAQLQQRPDDVNLIAGMAEVLLHQQKVTDAAVLVQKALDQNSSSAVLFTSLGDVQYRQGTPWLASASADKAMKLDPCYPPLRLLEARLLRLTSNYASAEQNIDTAHQLDPHNPAIRSLWLNTQPPRQRIAELESYLASDTGDDPEQLEHLRFELAFLKQQLVQPHKACRLVSNTATTEIPFEPIMGDRARIRAFGLDVKLNDHRARLQIDTGAGGLVISRSVAQHAGLERFSESKSSGVGSKGEQSSYTAYVDKITIGALEFHDCAVDVIDRRDVVDSDGLIGMDVFAHFLVTLDFPVRKLVLGPLPKRPDDTSDARPTLETAHSSADEEDSAGAEDPAAKPQPQPTPSPAAPRPRVSSARDRYIAPEMKDWSRIYRVGHLLLIPTLLNKKTTPNLFVLDTGAFATTISPTVAREVTRVYSTDAIKVHGISGEVDKVYTTDQLNFRFGNIEQPAREVVAFESPQMSKNAGLDIAGLIGATTLGQLTLKIDYRDGLVQFNYNPNRGYKYNSPY
jgi:Flp pilus assembly protein TadD/predicted aspartyl protease